MSHRPAAALIVLALASTASLAGTGPLTLLEQIRGAALAPGAGLAVSSLEFAAGPATIHLDGGTIFPAGPVGDRPVEFVFLGSGRLLADPPDEIEASQVELFTGQRTVDAPFTEAVFVLAEDEAVSLLTTRPPAQTDGDAPARAGAVLARWKRSPVRDRLGVDGSIFLDALGDPAMQRFFAGVFRGEDGKDFYCVIDPDADEQVTIGGFVPFDVTEKEKRKLRRLLHGEQRRGRLVGLDVEDLGSFDTWLSTSLRDPAGKPRPGGPPVTPEKYALDVTVGRVDRRVQGRAAIDLRAQVSGRTGFSLLLNPDLEVSRVSGAGDQPLTFVRSGAALTVALAKPTEAGVGFTLSVEYAGKPLQSMGHWSFALADTQMWYPRVGDAARAIYETTFHVPEVLDLLASGRKTGGGREADGMRWERWAIDVPTDNVSFELGQFKIVEEQVGHVVVTLAFDRGAAAEPAVVRKEIQDAVRDALTYFEQIFGPYPLDHLTVVTSPRDFSQGFLGFVTLSDPQMSNLGGWRGLIGLEDRRTIVAHEIAHQWWGNLVGFPSYRDQWLSEAMANYASILFARNQLKVSGSLALGPLRGWQRALGATTEDGRSVESLGPVVLGGRLDSSRFADAYVPIVYMKGAMVLGTLARVFREDQFLIMLGHLVKAAANKDLATDGFLAAIEKMSGQDLAWFGRQYVYGTGWPEVDYTFSFSPGAEGGWVIKGEARQRTGGRFRYRVVATPAGGYDVARTPVAEALAASASHLVVPFQVLAERQPPAAEVDGGKRTGPERVVEGGRVLLSGERSTFTISSENKPLDFWIDKHREVLATFYCETREPKLAVLGRGLDLAAAGDAAAAEAALREALAAPLSVDPTPDPEEEAGGDAEPDRGMRLADAAIHVALARLFLDLGRETEAEAEISVARAGIERGDRWLVDESRRRLEVRLALRRGDYAEPFKRLKRYLAPGGDDVETEGLALVAIAAHGAGKVDEFKQAAALCEKRGVDLSALRPTPR